MALIECYECGKKISDKAVACPSCGAPVSQIQTSNNSDSSHHNKANFQIDEPVEAITGVSKEDQEKLAEIRRKAAEESGTYTATPKKSCCPNCGSENWKSASLVREKGINNISTTTESAGFGISSSGSVAVGVGNSNTKGTIQNEISSKLKPPSPASSPLPPVMALIFIFCISIGLILDSNVGSGIAFALAFFSIIIGSVMNAPKNIKKDEKNMQTWQNTRMCTRCGTVYVKN